MTLPYGMVYPLASLSEGTPGRPLLPFRAIHLQGDHEVVEGVS